MSLIDLYEIECGFWPWVSRRKAGDAIREVKQNHRQTIDRMDEYHLNRYISQSDRHLDQMQAVRRELAQERDSNSALSRKITELQSQLAAHKEN